MAGSIEISKFTSGESDENTPDSKKSRKDKTESGSSKPARSVRFRLDGLDGAATRKPERSWSGHDFLTGAVLEGLKPEKKVDGTKLTGKPGAEVTEVDAEAAKPKGQATEAQAAGVSEMSQAAADSTEKPAAESDENDHDQTQGRLENSAFYADWAKSPNTEVVVPIDKEDVSGDMYVAHAVRNKEQPAEEADANQLAEAVVTGYTTTIPEAVAAEAEHHEQPEPVIGWHEQPMRQQGARDYEVPPAAVPGGGGEMQPPRGPEDRAFGLPPDPEEGPHSFVPVSAPAEYSHGPEPAEIFRDHARRDAAAAIHSNTVSPSEELVTRREADERAYRHERIGQNRGFGVGLALAAYEHFKHRRREKKAAKAHREQIRKLQKIQENQAWVTKEQTQRQAETTRQLQSAEARLVVAERRPQFQPLAPAEVARLAERQAREQSRPQGAEQPAEQLVIPPEHRVETSAWLYTEVDARTGQPVEAPAAPRGEEYYEERRHEIPQFQQRNAAAGEVALVASGVTGGVNGDGAQPDDGAALPVDIPNASMQGPPSSARKTPQPLSAPAPKPPLSGMPLWTYLVTLVAIVICLVVLLH